MNDRVVDNPAEIHSSFTVRTASRRDLDALVRVCLAWQGAPAARNPGLLRELLEQALSDDDATLRSEERRVGKEC